MHFRRTEVFDELIFDKLIFDEMIFDELIFDEMIGSVILEAYKNPRRSPKFFFVFCFFCCYQIIKLLKIYFIIY